MNYCPRQAVEASYPFGALLVYLTGLPVMAWLLDGLARRFAGWAGLRGPLLDWLIAYPYKLLAIGAAYLLFSAALRLPTANRLLTWLTPTRFYRRYHAPGARLSDITRTDGQKKG